MHGENRSLLTNEPIGFEKELAEVQDFQRKLRNILEEYIEYTSNPWRKTPEDFNMELVGLGNTRISSGTLLVRFQKPNTVGSSWPAGDQCSQFPETSDSQLPVEWMNRQGWGDYIHPRRSWEDGLPLITEGGAWVIGIAGCGATLVVVHMHSWLPLTWPACAFNDVLQSFLMNPHLLLLSPSGSSVRIKLRDVCARYKGRRENVFEQAQTWNDSTVTPGNKCTKGTVRQSWHVQMCIVTLCSCKLERGIR